MRRQTCRRHPFARFLRTCHGCAQDLHDTEQANRRAAEQLDTALATVAGTDSSTRITSITQTANTLIVIAKHTAPDAPYAYTVDTFRQATDDETDPELVDPLAAGTWVLIDQHVGHDPSDIDRMYASARAYLVELGLADDQDEAAA